MSLSEKSRREIYTGLIPIVGNEAAEEMLSYFPARDIEEPVSKEFLRAENILLRSEVRSEMADLGQDLRTEMADLGQELRTEMAGLGQELRSEMTGLGQELRSEMAELNRELSTEMRGLGHDLRAEMRNQLYWLVGLIVTLNSATIALIFTLR